MNNISINNMKNNRFESPQRQTTNKTSTKMANKIVKKNREKKYRKEKKYNVYSRRNGNGGEAARPYCDKLIIPRYRKSQYARSKSPLYRAHMVIYIYILQFVCALYTRIHIRGIYTHSEKPSWNTTWYSRRDRIFRWKRGRAAGGGSAPTNY